MKALAIDGASNIISFLATNNEKQALLSLDLSMQQSEKLLPSIDAVLKNVGLEAKDISFLALTKGPGTFTGLRLAFSAAKALSLSFSIPIYAIPTLDLYANAFASWNGAVLSALDAKKNRFYASLYRKGKKNIGELDINACDLAKKLDPEEKILCVGPDAHMLIDALVLENPNLDLHNFSIHVSAAMFHLQKMAEIQYKEKSPPLNDWEGPFYLRLSEAEENKAKP